MSHEIFPRPIILRRLPYNMTSSLYSPPFIRMAFANFCNVASFGGFFLFPLFVSNHGGSEADSGIIMGTFSLSSVLCRPWISEMVDRIGRKRSYTIGCLIMSVLPLTYLLFRGDLETFYLPLLLIRFFHFYPSCRTVIWRFAPILL